MATRFEQMTTSSLIEQLRSQKTSHEMDDEETSGADWQDGYDAMVECVRVLFDNLDL